MTRHDTRSKPSTLLSIALLFLAPAISGCRAVPPVPEPGHYGDFNTQVVARWQLDGRAMEVVYPLRFVDATGIRWEVPTGAVVDGASIPPVLWSFFGGPYEGLYRDASVVHDYACDHPDGRTWKQIHRMFWYGARARGETAPRAAVMYWAILIAGPPWSRTEAIELRKRDV